MTTFGRDQDLCQIIRKNEMRAIVYEDFKAPLEIRNVPDPGPENHGVVGLHVGERVRADDEVKIGVNGLAGTDQRIPPAGQGVLSSVPARSMRRARPVMADQDGVVAGIVERAVGLVADFYVQGCTSQKPEVPDDLALLPDVVQSPIPTTPSPWRHAHRVPGGGSAVKPRS